MKNAEEAVGHDGSNSAQIGTKNICGKERESMFLINVTYIKEIAQVEEALPAHVQYLEDQYAKGNFVCSGRKNPRTGGIILCRCGNRDAVEELVKQDPFHRQQIAQYEIIEFIPSKYAPEFQACLEKPI